MQEEKIALKGTGQKELEKTNLGKKYNEKGWDLQNGLTSGTPDPDAAIEWYEKAVECGSTTAMVNLGNIYENREEFDQAYYWYLEAALADNEQGMFNVANMHFWGRHVPQDYQKAYDYFVKLNELGVKGTYFYLGLYAENGYLDEPDYEKAKYCYTKGIEEGDIYCPVNLGRMYCLGLGGSVDYEKGFDLYYQGYLMGDVLACANLGYCYETGQGVEKDMGQALLYYKEGAEKGEEHCAEAVKRLLSGDGKLPLGKEIDVSCRDKDYLLGNEVTLMDEKRLSEIQEKSSFENFSYRDWCDYYNALNEEKPVEECPFKLSENEKRCYEAELKRLKTERANNPGIPISYDMPKYSWFD